jgi:flagellar L-ring protein precursor FlgH
MFQLSGLRYVSFIVILGLTILGASPLSAQSLVTAKNLSNGTMYSDQVARQAGDLITIQVNESTTVAESQTTDTSRQMDISAAITAIPNNARVAGASGSSTVGKLPVMSGNSSKTFTGEGSYDQQNRMSTMITGRVIDVLDNGNLVIEGRRTLVFGENSKTIRITGIVRTADLNSDNFVMSERIHNMQVAIEGEGPINRSQQEGLLGRLFDFIWPL